MHAINKLSAVASLAAPILIGGAAGVAAAELPVAAAPADTVTAAAHTAGPSRPATASPGSATAPVRGLRPGEHHTGAGGPGERQDPPGVNVDRQSSDRNDTATLSPAASNAGRPVNGTLHSAFISGLYPPSRVKYYETNSAED
jgi:hypothetical protein